MYKNLLFVDGLLGDVELTTDEESELGGISVEVPVGIKRNVKISV